MDVSLQLLFKDQDTEALREVWRSQAAVTGSRTLIDGPYDPHITLGLFKGLDHVTFSEELRTLAASVPEFDVRFGHVGQFTGDEGTLFLVPVRNDVLAKLHSDILDICDTLNGTVARPEHYLIDKWVPHCSVSWRTERASILEGLKHLLSTGYPASATASSLFLMHTPDDRPLAKVSLSSAVQS
jgi:hypothetical protein